MRNQFHLARWMCATIVSACLASCATDGAATDEISQGVTTNASVQLWYDWNFGTQVPKLSLKTGKNLANTENTYGATAVVARPDHRALIAGVVLQPSSQTYCPTVAQFTADGVLDTSFGTGGIAVVPVCDAYTEINAAVLQPDGKIVIGGRNGVDYFLLVRLLPTGALDGSFGFAGLVITSTPTIPHDWANALALQPDGKIVAGGSGHIIRYNANGGLDASFGSSGVAATPTGIGINGMALQPDGKILIVDNAVSGVARLTASGAADPTFAQGGIASFPIGGGGYSVVVRSDGKIVVGGFHSFSEEGIDYELGLVARLLPTGALDTTLNRTGLVDIASPGHNNRRVAAVQSLPDGSVVTAGWDHRYSDDLAELVMAHVFDDGTLDPNFGTTQTVMQSDFSPLGTAVSPSAMVLDSLPSQTRVLLAADVTNNTGYQQLGIARLVFVAAP